MRSLKKLSLTLLILSVIASNDAFSQCIEGKTKYILQNKEIISIEKYCYDLKSKIFFSSNKCVDDKICMSNNLNSIEIKTSELNFEIGSPGFKICNLYNGTPQVIDFWAEKKWHPMSRCNFSDGSFIDNSSLFQKVKFLD